VDLPAFLLSKSVYSDSIGMFRLHRNVSGGTYPIALRDLAFQLSFASVLDLVMQEDLLSLPPTSHDSLRHFRKTKNPASSAGYSHSHLSGSTRSSTLSILCS